MQRQSPASTDAPGLLPDVSAAEVVDAPPSEGGPSESGT
jgi:hypothetical protein